MLERHQDYVIRGVTVPAGGSAQFDLLLDPDAPFALRCLLSSGIGKFQFSLFGYDQKRYMGGNGNPSTVLDSLLDQASLPFIFYPQITFPSQVAMQVTVYDVVGAGITNGVLVFRGTKLYQPGAVFGPQYPPKFTELNFRYAYPFTIGQGTANNPTVLSGQPLDIQSDADFVVRMCSAFNSAGDNYAPTATDVILRDQYGKPYSNDWVPIDLLFPQNVPPYATIYPEIYLAKNTQLLLDLRRTSGTQNDNITLVLHGSKIFEAQGG